MLDMRGKGEGGRGKGKDQVLPNHALLPSPFPLPAGTGTVLAFDFGERYLGVAVGEEAMQVAHPLGTIDARHAAARFDAIAKLVAEWRPARFVVGLPLGPDGERHALAPRVERFARQLEGRFRVPVTLVDERLSSAEAETRLRALGRGRRKDKDLAHPMSAQVILQDHFDRDAAA
jgi:putative Holliday junction resolvase